MTDPTYDFTVTRVFGEPVERVWQAWADAERVAEWWGPHGFTGKVLQMDFREGRATLVSMSSPQVGEIFNTWTYERIEPMRRIEFVVRFADAQGTPIDPIAPGVPAAVPHVVTFTDLGNGRTEMTITESGYSSAEAAAMSKAGQEQVVEKMAASVENA